MHSVTNCLNIKCFHHIEVRKILFFLYIFAFSFQYFIPSYASNQEKGKNRLHVTAEYKLLSRPMGIDYVVIGFDMEVQPSVTHNAA